MIISKTKTIILLTIGFLLQSCNYENYDDVYNKNIDNLFQITLPKHLQHKYEPYYPGDGQPGEYKSAWDKIQFRLNRKGPPTQWIAFGQLHYVFEGEITINGFSSSSYVNERLVVSLYSSTMSLPLNADEYLKYIGYGENVTELEDHRPHFVNIFNGKKPYEYKIEVIKNTPAVLVEKFVFNYTQRNDFSKIKRAVSVVIISDKINNIKMLYHSLHSMEDTIKIAESIFSKIQLNHENINKFFAITRD